jgi:hypothetical protein
VTKKFSSIKRRKLHLTTKGPLTSCLENAMPSALFAVGYLLVVVVSWLAYLSHIPEPYIFGILVILLGIGAVSRLEHDRQKNLRC